MFKLFSLSNKKKLDQHLIDELEDELIMADTGVEITTKIIDSVKKLKMKPESSIVDVKKTINLTIVDMLKPYEKKLELNQKPFVITVCGTNGAGKTTSIAKLAHFLKNQGFNKVLLIAADTFRSAATEQLEIWGQKLNLEVMTGAHMSDPAALVFKGCTKAVAENFDVVISDTSGRFANNENLMQELQKINKVIAKVNPNYPHETILVLDGTLGQSSLMIVESFTNYININSLLITKLDGSSKGGMILPLTQKLKIPILFLGFGEAKEDLTPFNSCYFSEQMLGL